MAGFTHLAGFEIGLKVITTIVLLRHIHMHLHIHMHRMHHLRVSGSAVCHYALFTTTMLHRAFAHRTMRFGGHGICHTLKRERNRNDEGQEYAHAAKISGPVPAPASPKINLLDIGQLGLSGS